MHARGIIGLVLVVAVLFAMRSWMSREEAKELDELREVVASHALLEGLLPEDMPGLKRVRIDNLERGVQLTIERDSRGSWYLTDPVAWPADVSVLKLFFETLAGNSGTEARDVDPAAAGLEPPVAHAELDFGEERGTWSVDVGRADLDGQRLYIRTQAPGAEPRVLRANRSLEGIFQRFVPDYRSKAIVRIEPTDVVEVGRTGAADYPSYNSGVGIVGPGLEDVPNPLLVAQGELFPTLDLRLINGSSGWRVEQPFSGAADPQALSMLLLTLCNLDARAFKSEEALDLGRFGLDRPEVELRLSLVDHKVRRLRFARDPDERARAELDGTPPAGADWLCMVDDGPEVFVVEPKSVLLAAAPAEAFFDYRILRGDLKEASACRLEGGGRAAELVQEGGSWFVSGRGPGGVDYEHLPADRAVVEEVLLAFRGAELGDLLPGVEPAPSFVPETLSVKVSGLERGGTFGPPPAGVAADYLFRRTGDKLWAAVDPELVQLLQLGPEHFLERRLLDVEELRLASVQLSRAGRELVFRRDEATGSWQRTDQGMASMAFGLLVDRLRSIKVLEFVFDPPDLEGAQEAGIEVTLSVAAETGPRGRPAREVVYTVWPGEDADLVLFDGRWGKVYTGLWAGLSALFD